MNTDSLKHKLIETLSLYDAKYIATTTCYNIHEFKAESSNSNLTKLIKSLPPAAKGRGYLVIVGSKGRTAHSASDLHVFDAPTNGTIGSTETLWRDYWWF